MSNFGQYISDMPLSQMIEVIGEEAVKALIESYGNRNREDGNTPNLKFFTASTDAYIGGKPAPDKGLSNSKEVKVGDEVYLSCTVDKIDGDGDLVLCYKCYDAKLNVTSTVSRDQVYS